MRGVGGPWTASTRTGAVRLYDCSFGSCAPPEGLESVFPASAGKDVGESPAELDGPEGEVMELEDVATDGVVARVPGAPGSGRRSRCTGRRRLRQRQAPADPAHGRFGVVLAAGRVELDPDGHLAPGLKRFVEVHDGPVREATGLDPRAGPQPVSGHRPDLEALHLHGVADRADAREREALGGRPGGRRAPRPAEHAGAGRDGGLGLDDQVLGPHPWREPAAVDHRGPYLHVEARPDAGPGPPGRAHP